MPQSQPAAPEETVELPPSLPTPVTRMPLDREAELDRLAALAGEASGVGIQLLNLVGEQAEGLLNMLPSSAVGRLEKATESALGHAFTAASVTRGRIPDAADWLTRAVALGTGAAGGVGGIGSALAELPVTVTVILRGIQGIAAEHGFDPDDPAVRAACLKVFGAAGPLRDDEHGTDLSFLTLRLTMTGPAISKIISRLAPRLALPLGQKLAAQAVPVLGAAAGAATNWVYTSYYQDMARVQFGLLRLARDTGEEPEALLAALKERMEAPT
jgi:hypothetical protein